MRHGPLGYLFAMAVSLAMLALALFLRPWIEESPFPLFLASVMLSTWFGGIGPGILATVIGALAGTYFFLGESHSFQLTTATSATRLLVYTLVAVLISWLNEKLRIAQRRAETARAVAESTAAEMQSVERISMASLAHLTLNDLLEALLTSVREALAVDGVRVLLLSEDDRALRVRASTGLSPGNAANARLPLSQGLAGQCAERGTAILAHELPGSAGDEGDRWDGDIRSLAAVPLVIEGRTIGVLDIGASSLRPFARPELRLLQLVADRVAGAIERARLLEAEQVARQRAELSAERTARLQSITSALSGALTPERAADIVTEQAISALDAREAVIALLTDPGGDVHLVRASGDPSGMLSCRVGQKLDGDTPFGRCLKSGEPAWADTLAIHVGRDSSSAGEAGRRSSACVPLLLDGRTVGLMGLSFDDYRVLDEEERVFILALAQQCAQALERARLDDAQRKAYSAARDAVTVRDEFLAHASHELRTPLAHIKGFVSSLRQTDIEWDDDTRADFLAEIEREADRLAKMITDLLDMSRLESGGLAPVDRTRATPRQLVEGGIDRVRGLLANRTVEIEMPTDLPHVLVDVDQVERVIANLVENAAKYSPLDRPIRVNAVRGESEVDIRVDDEGPGIPKDALDQIFEKFVRVIPQDAGVPGTGLGLAISRHIANAHGGELWAENRHRGARFVLRLPRTAVKESRDGPRAYSNRR
jgi:K+-sensing histidine kinase KdpD